MKKICKFFVLLITFSLGLMPITYSYASVCPDGYAPAISKMRIIFKNNSDKDFKVRGTSSPAGAIAFTPGDQDAKAGSAEIPYSNSQPLCVGTNTFAAWVADPKGTPLYFTLVITVQYSAQGVAHVTKVDPSSTPPKGYTFEFPTAEDQTIATARIIIKRG